MAGTIFDRSRVSLQQWFAAAWYVTNQKHGVSALGLQRLLGLGSWRQYFDSDHHNELFLRATAANALLNAAHIGFIDLYRTMQMIPSWPYHGRAQLLQDGPCRLIARGFGRVRMQRVDDVSGASLVPFVCAVVESGSEVHTDGWKGYNGLSEQGYRHRLTKISGSGDPAHVSMPGVHRVAALLKRWLLGTHQGSVTAEHLDAYLNEFAFRFNRRHSRRRGLLFLRLLQNAVVTPPTRYRPSRSLAQMQNHSR